MKCTVSGAGHYLGFTCGAADKMNCRVSVLLTNKRMAATLDKSFHRPPQLFAMAAYNINR